MYYADSVSWDVSFNQRSFDLSVWVDVGDIMKTKQGILCICQMQNCLTDGFEKMCRKKHEHIEPVYWASQLPVNKHWELICLRH